MTTSTQHAVPKSAAEQGTYHYILAMQKPTDAGLIWAGIDGTLSPSPGVGRHDVYRWAIDALIHQRPEIAGGFVNYWALEPNAL